MSFSDSKIPLPYVWFSVGLFPWIILLLVAQFYEPVTHADPLVLLIYLAGLFAIVVTPICFLRGFFQSVKFTGKHRYIGLTLNGLGLGILFSFLIYVWVLN